MVEGRYKSGNVERAVLNGRGVRSIIGGAVVNTTFNINGQRHIWNVVLIYMEHKTYKTYI